MAYSSWSVVFGEQPSAAKWNILGTNDAEFNSMIVHTAGGLTTFNDIRYQRDDANSITSETKDTVLIQTGWGQIVGDGTAKVEETVTFPTAFDEILNVIAGALDANTGSAAATITGLNTAISSGPFMVQIGDITTSDFEASLLRSDSVTFGVGDYFGYSWIAIGTKA